MCYLPTYLDRSFKIHWVEDWDISIIDLEADCRTKTLSRRIAQPPVRVHGACPDLSLDRVVMQHLHFKSIYLHLCIVSTVDRLSSHSGAS